MDIHEQIEAIKKAVTDFEEEYLKRIDEILDDLEELKKRIEEGEKD